MVQMLAGPRRAGSGSGAGTLRPPSSEMLSSHTLEGGSRLVALSPSSGGLVNGLWRLPMVTGAWTCLVVLIPGV